MFDNFLPIPDAESLPFYPLVLKLVLCAQSASAFFFKSTGQNIGLNGIKKLQLLKFLYSGFVLTGIWELYWLSAMESDDPELLALYHHWAPGIASGGRNQSPCIIYDVYTWCCLKERQGWQAQQPCTVFMAKGPSKARHISNFQNSVREEREGLGKCHFY